MLPKFKEIECGISFQHTTDYSVVDVSGKGQEKRYRYSS